MVERIVLIKLSNEHGTNDSKQQVLEHSLQVLAKIPGVVEVRGGIADETTTEWDLLLRLAFASAAAVEPYRVHPDHRAYVDEYLRPRLQAIKAYNFELA